MRNCCIACKWFVPWIDDEEESFGLCHYYPPALHPIESASADRLPQTEPINFCSKWEAGV